MARPSAQFSGAPADWYAARHTDREPYAVMSGLSGRRRGGLLPLAVTLAATAGVTAWLVVHLLRGDGTVAPGYAGGPVAMVAAAFACGRIGSMVKVPRPVRGFWRQLSHAATCLAIGAGAALAFANNDPGMSPYVAAPVLLGVVMAMLGFLHLPLDRRSALNWLQTLLDGATVAVAGSLIFFYVVFGLAVPGISAVTKVGAAVVGVGGLLAVVVIGKAALAPAGPVDPVSLRLLTVAPMTGVVAAVLQIAGSATGRLALSVLAMPIVATAICAAAHRQLRVLQQPAAEPPARPARSLFNTLPFLAVTVTAVLVVSVSARQMSWHQRTVIIGAVLIAACVVLRQLVGLRENRRLLAGIRRQQVELTHLAMHDPLTGLANRARSTTRRAAASSVAGRSSANSSPP